MKNLPQIVVRLLAVSLVYVGCLAVAATNLPLAEAQSDAGTLTVAPDRIWAGRVALGNTVNLPCTLQNSGTASLTITNAASSNPDYGLISPALPLTLAPGDSVACAIGFAPTAASREHGSIAFTSNASNAMASVWIHGWGTSQADSGQAGGGAAIVASAPAIGFGSVAEGGTQTKAETLTNGGQSTITISSVSTSGPGFGQNGISTPITLDSGASITFNLLFDPETSGAATGSLTVLSDASNPILTVGLTGTGTESGSLALSPANPSFGAVNVGSSKTMTAALTASGNAVTVSSATTTSSEFTLSGMSFPATIAAGTSASFTLQFAPTSSGSASANLSFASNAGSPTVETATGTGIATDSHTVMLQWEPSASSVSGYNVYRGSTSGGPYSKQTSSLDADSSYTDGSVQAGQTYYYVVTSENSDGSESANSNQVQAIIPTP